MRPADGRRRERGAGGEHRDERGRAPDVGPLRDEPRGDRREHRSEEREGRRLGDPAHDHAPRPARRASRASSSPTPLVPRSSAIASSTAITEHAAIWPATSRPNELSSGRGSRRQTRAAATGITARSITASRSRVRERETGHRHDVVVAHAVAEPRHHDRDLDGLAVLVAGVEVEGVRERAEPEDAVARLDVVQPVARPQARPAAQDEVAELLVGPVVREVAPGEHRVEALVDRDLDELVRALRGRAGRRRRR